MSSSVIGALEFRGAFDYRTESRASSGMIRSLAARTRYLEELTSGKSAVDDERPCTPPNPQGLTGIDLSGPPWGSAIWHPIFASTGINTASMQQPTQSLLLRDGLVSGIDIYASLRMRFWVRPFDRFRGGVAPYSRGLIVVRSHGDAATATTVTVKAIGSGQPASQAQVGTYSNASTSTTSNVLSSWLDLQPGDNNALLVFQKSGGAPTITIDSVTVYQGVKRSH